MDDYTQLTNSMRSFAGIAGESIKQGQLTLLSLEDGMVYQYTTLDRARHLTQLMGIATHDINKGDLIAWELDLVTHAGTSKDDEITIHASDKAYLFPNNGGNDGR